MSEANRSPEHQTPPPGHLHDRLDSWKEIAIFLQRDVRTVQRWEKHAGLPVHRHAESRLRTAYAYRSELEAWWQTQRTTVEPTVADADADAALGTPDAPEPGSPPISRFPRRRLAATIAIVVIGSVAIVGGTSGWFWRRASPGTPQAPGRPLVVVLARFEDHAENPHLASVIEGSVARELARRGQMEIAPPARITRTLRLMRRDPHEPLTEALGRELVVRDLRINYVITGRVHRFGVSYFADVKALDVDGRAHANVEWRAATAEQLVSQSREVLAPFAQLMTTRAAGQARPVEAFEQVTSASTAAVRLYTAALQAASRGQWAASELLARRAVDLDPEFASAHGWLGWAMRRQGRSAREALSSLGRALALSREVTDQETYFISGMFQAVGGDLPAAVAALEALRRLNPTHRQALDMLVEVSWRMGRVKRAVELSVIRAEAYPDDFYANVRAAQALAAGQGSNERAAAFAHRANQLTSPEAVGDRPTWNAWLHVLPVFQKWIGGDPRGARDALVALDRGLPNRLGRERDAFASAVGFAHLAFGQTRQAERAFRYGSAPDRQINLAVLALTQGDEEGARRWLGQVRKDAARAPSLFARVGFNDEAVRGLESLLPSNHSEGIAAVTRGLLALRQKQMEPAAAQLREGLDLLRSSGEPAYFFAAEALASIADARGDVGRSITLLSDAAAERAHTYGFSQWTAAYWIRMSTDLVRHCRRAGRHDDAERISAGLRQILDVGEPQSPGAETQSR